VEVRGEGEQRKGSVCEMIAHELPELLWWGEVVVLEILDVLDGAGGEGGGRGENGKQGRAGIEDYPKWCGRETAPMRRWFGRRDGAGLILENFARGRHVLFDNGGCKID